MNKNENDLKKFWDLIKHLEVVLFTTMEPDGTLHTRPMAALQTDFDGSLWFFTEAASHKVDEINHHPQVNVTYVDSVKNRFISASGKAHVVRDRAKARELWLPFLRAWFPNGVDSPEVTLLRVQVDKVEFWESPSSKSVGLLGFSITTTSIPSATSHTLAISH